LYNQLYTDIAVRSVHCHTATGTNVPIWDHIEAEVTFLPLLQQKLILNLATPKGCKAELT